MTRWANDPERRAAAIKLFHALISAPRTERAKRVTVEARDLQEAKSLLEEIHGAGTVYSLWVDHEWDALRDK
jgi:hypothetical protein